MQSTAAGKKPSVVADGLMRVGESARFLGIGRSKLYGLMDSGRLQYVKIDTARRIPKAALVKLAESCLVGAAEQ